MLDDCTPCTPSGDNARQLVAGDLRALAREPGYLLGRCALIGAGCYLAGVRGKQLLKSTALGGVAMEAFILGYQLFMKQKAAP